MLAVFAAMVLMVPSGAGALTSGETYTITVQALESDGSLATASSSANATADSDGKISFTLSSVPNNDSCNFLVVTVKDSGDNTVRRSIAPCPNAGEALPMGVSGLTDTQTDALIEAVAAAGTDDPILATFGFAIVRSSAITSTELTHMATFCSEGINGTGGFVEYLTNEGVTSAQLIAYRGYIVDRLANTSTGYSKLIKDSVDASTDAEKLNARGEAASKLLLVLVQAATDAGFSQDRVLEAFNAMGSVVVPLMETAVDDAVISAATAQMIDSSIGGGIQKLRADKEIEKYSAALTSLGATGDDVIDYQSAATTLMNAMEAAFKTFEQVFDGTETESEIAAAESTMSTAMDTAFSQFMTDTAAGTDSDYSRITTMIANIDTALGESSDLSESEFKYYMPDGTEVYWPLTMVVLVDWVSEVVGDGGSLSYTRDTTDIPSNLEWLGTCTGGSYYSKTECESNMGVGAWTAERTDFEADDVPASYAALFGIQQDIEILEFTRWGSQESAGSDMEAHATLEKAFSDNVAALASNIGGTSDGSTAHASAIKSAILTLLKSPQF